MRKIIKDINTEFQKGTRITLVENDNKRWIEKKWISGSKIFSADYEYKNERNIYKYLNKTEPNFHIPKLIDFNDSERIILLNYIPDARHINLKKTDKHLLDTVLNFYIDFSKIKFTDTPLPVDYSCDEIHQFRLFIINRVIKDSDIINHYLDLGYELMKNQTTHYIPYDGLHNAIKSYDKLYYLDFEWMISGPIEFLYARWFLLNNLQDPDGILPDTINHDLLNYFLLEFFILNSANKNRLPKNMTQYLKSTIKNKLLLKVMSQVKKKRWRKMNLTWLRWI